MLPNNGFVMDECLVTNCGPNGDINALQMYAPNLCAKLIKSAEEWWALKKTDPTVLENAPNLLRYRPEGEGFFAGIPLIA